MAAFLVTGGCGFIGAHLAANLIARGDVVRVLDDLSTGAERNLPRGAQLIIGDVADPLLVREAAAGVDGVFHLAAVVSVERCRQDWLAAHRTNLSGTIAVFEALRGRRVPIVYASSAAVYGEQAMLPITEHATPRPRSAYGADKLAAELHACVAGIVHGIPSLGLRFFNVFGPGQDPGSPYSGVVSIFCDRLCRGAGVEIHGDGEQTRDFVHVGDAVAALIAGMAAATAEAPVVNVCTGRPVSVHQLAETIAGACNIDARISFRPPRAGDIRHSCGDPTRMRSMLGAREPRSLEDGIAEVLAWMRAGRPSLSEGQLGKVVPIRR